MFIKICAKNDDGVDQKCLTKTVNHAAKISQTAKEFDKMCGFFYFGAAYFEGTPQKWISSLNIFMIF